MRTDSYGQEGFSLLDRFGVWLSKRAVMRHLDERRDLFVADLGCGYHATLLTSLGPYAANGIGVDIRVSDRLRGIANLTFIEARIEDALPTFEDCRFDLLLCLSVLEHLAAPEVALEQCYRKLKAEGRLFVNVPTWRGKAFLEFSAFRLGASPAAEMDDHKMYYDKRDLWPMLVRAGFKPSRVALKYHKLGLNLFAIAQK
jgi:SAM-dependent methyltransferase